MTAVVIDASAGVELIADTLRGRALRSLLPPGAVPWVPELFYVECASVLRRMELREVITPAQATRAVRRLLEWHLRVVDARGLLLDAWGYRANITLGDAVYVALAQHLNAPLLTEDRRLVKTRPQLPVATLHLP